MAGPEGLKSVQEIRRSVEMVGIAVKTQIRIIADERQSGEVRMGAREKLTKAFFDELREFGGAEILPGELANGQAVEMGKARIGGREIRNCKELLEVYRSREGLTDVQWQRLGIIWSGIYDGIREGVAEVVGEERAGEILAMPEGDERDKVLRSLYGGSRVMKGMGGAAEAGLREVTGEEAEVREEGGVEEKEEEEVEEPLGTDMVAVVAELRALRREMADREGGGARGEVDMAGEDLRTKILGKDTMQRYYERSLRLQEKMEEVTEVKWLEGLMSKSASQSPPPGLWQVEVPSWMEGVVTETAEVDKETDWRWIFELTDALSVAVATRRKDGKFQKDVEYIEEVIISMAPVPEKFLAYLYDHCGLGFKEALEYVAGDLLEVRELDRVDGLDGSGTEHNRVKYWIFKEIGGNYAPQVWDFQRDSSEYKKKMAKKLVGDGVCGTFEQAQVAVSMACDALELGGVWELADSKRRIGYASDALRVVMRPETKFRAKVGAGEDPEKKPEIFGGPWAEYLLSLTDMEPVAALNKGRAMGIIPQLLCGSILNKEVEIDEIMIGRDSRPIYDKEGNPVYRKVAFGEALTEKKKIRFGEAEDDFYFGWKKDGVMAACAVWRYIANDKPLEFKTISEADNVVSKWRKTLYNTVKALRENECSVVTTEIVAAAIGGSVGLWPVEERPYLRLSTQGPDFVYNYLKLGSEIIRLLGFPSQEQVKLREFFGIDKSVNAKKMNKAVARYRIMTDPGITETKRRLLLRTL